MKRLLPFAAGVIVGAACAVAGAVAYDFLRAGAGIGHRH